MSGRRLAVDRSVVLDLNRHLRPAVTPHARRDDEREVGSAGRPDAALLIEAVSTAAQALTTRDERIRQLEQHQQEVEALVDRMRAKLGELVRLQQTTDMLAKSETERAARAEARANALETRVQDLEGDLDAALADLHRIADVITGSLVPAGRR